MKKFCLELNSNKKCEIKFWVDLQVFSDSMIQLMWMWYEVSICLLINILFYDITKEKEEVILVLN